MNPKSKPVTSQELVDSHSHIHSSDYNLDVDQVIKRSVTAGVKKIVCVGTDEKDSRRAVEFVKNRPNCWASVGLHPHDAKLGQDEFTKLSKLVDSDKVVAIGECGLDYFYSHSPKTDQIRALRWQIELAIENNLPLIFHVREAFDDFWPILDDYEGARGVVHSFSSSTNDLDQAINRGLMLGINGIMTFTKDPGQLESAKAIPLEKLLLETDSPFLTPSPHRGKVNEPRYVSLIAEFMAQLRQEPVEVLSQATTKNARRLFKL